MEILFKKENLFIRIAIGFAIGVILGFAAPGFSIATKVVGEIYLNLIKMLVIPVLVCAVLSGITGSGNISGLRRIGLKAIGLYVIMFLASFAVSFGVASLIRPGSGISFENPPVYEGEVGGPVSFSDVLRGFFPDNIIEAMSANNILPTLLFSVILGIAIVAIGDKGRPVKEFIDSLTEAMFYVLSMIMETSPIGVMSLIAYSVAEFGAGVFMAIGKYVLCCWLACIAVFFIVFFLPSVTIGGADPKTYLRASGKIALMTMSTTSSAATLPTTLKVSTEDLGVPEYIANFTLPLGCTINMCGGACSFCCLAVFVNEFYGLGMPLSRFVMMAVVATLINMAAPGIPGGGIVLMTSFLTIFGLPVDLIGPIAAFYRLLDMAFTTINVSGDVAANLIIAKTESKVIESLG